MNFVQIRHVELVCDGPSRPAFRVLCPVSWNDREIAGVASTILRRWVGYVYPTTYVPPKAAKSSAIWLGLSVDQVKQALTEGEGRFLSEQERERLRSWYPEVNELL